MLYNPFLSKTENKWNVSADTFICLELNLGNGLHFWKVIERQMHCRKCHTRKARLILHLFSLFFSCFCFSPANLSIWNQAVQHFLFHSLPFSGTWPSSSTFLIIVCQPGTAFYRINCILNNNRQFDSHSITLSPLHVNNLPGIHVNNSVPGRCMLLPLNIFDLDCFQLLFFGISLCCRAFPTVHQLLLLKTSFIYT